MLLHKHIVNPSKVALFSDLNGGNYPIGLSVEDYLDLFADGKAFQIDGFAFIDDSLARQVGGPDIISQLDSLQSVGKTPISNLSGRTTRSVIPIGKLDKEGKESAVFPNTLVNYPFHIGGNQDGSLIIDFGKTLISADLLFPFIEITFANGFTSQNFGTIVGNIVFMNHGAIPIYSGSVDIGVVLGGAGGAIKLAERYSDLKASTLSAQVGNTISFRNSADVKSLSTYTKALFGTVEADVAGDDSELSIVVPKNAKSGPIRIEAYSPQFDSFLSYEEITIS